MHIKKQDWSKCTPIPILRLAPDQAIQNQSIRMSQWCHTIIDGAKFWIFCQQLRILRKAIHWQLIQNLEPSTIVWCQCNIWIDKNWMKIFPKPCFSYIKCLQKARFCLGARWKDSILKKGQWLEINSLVWQLLAIILFWRLSSLNWRFFRKTDLYWYKYNVSHPQRPHYRYPLEAVQHLPLQVQVNSHYLKII